MNVIDLMDMEMTIIPVIDGDASGILSSFWYRVRPHNSTYILRGHCMGPRYVFGAIMGHLDTPLCGVERSGAGLKIEWAEWENRRGVSGGYIKMCGR